MCVFFLGGGGVGRLNASCLWFRKKKKETIQLGVCFFSGWKQFLPGSGGIVVSWRFLLTPKVVAENDESY